MDQIAAAKRGAERSGEFAVGNAAEFAVGNAAEFAVGNTAFAVHFPNASKSNRITASTPCFLRAEN